MSSSKQNVTDFLLENAVGSRPVTIASGGSRTYSDLKEAAARIAAELLALGRRPGDRVGILGQNSFFWIASYLAIMKLGMVAVPFPTTVIPAEMKRSGDWVDCSAMLLDRRQKPNFIAAFGDRIPAIFDDVFDGPGPSAWPAIQENCDPDSDAALMFTSGTTAHPKAVRITHRNIRANTESIIEYLGLRASDRMMVILPFFYCFGTSLLHTHLRVGGSVALMNSFAFPESALDMIESAECSGFAGVPSSFQLLLRASTFAKRSLPSLRLIQQAGGRLQDVLIKELVASKPSVRFYVMYGQTEATARLSFLSPDMLEAKLGSIGRGIPGVRLEVLREDGSPVRPGEVGEIVARGDNISPGYLNDAEATALKFVDGALHTGDLAAVDADGYISIVDRRDDFIKSWGYRVSSQEIESCVLQLTDVVSAAAVGVPSLASGEAITVFVTIRPGAGITVGVVQDHCRRRLARYMVPEAVVFIDSMPLNSSGKIMKAELRRRASG